MILYLYYTGTVPTMLGTALIRHCQPSFGWGEGKDNQPHGADQFMGAACVYAHYRSNTCMFRLRGDSTRPNYVGCNTVIFTLPVVLVGPSGDMQLADSTDLARCMYLNATSGTRRRIGHGFSNAVKCESS